MPISPLPVCLYPSLYLPARIPCKGLVTQAVKEFTKRESVERKVFIHCPGKERGLVWRDA